MDNHNKHIHYTGLDVVRGLSAILIMLYHYTTRYNQNPITDGAKTDWSISVPWGCAAVTTFFILSGFLCAKHLIKSDSKKKEVISFLKKRLLRLYPTFFCALIITFLVTHICYPQAACSIKDAVLNLTMVPSLLGANSVDGAYWTLRVEWIFYFIVAFTMFFSNSNIKKTIFVGWVAISVLLFFFKTLPFVNTLNVLFVFNHSQEFVTGIAIWLLLRNPKDVYAYVMLCLSVVNHILWSDAYHIILYSITVPIIITFCVFNTNLSFKDPLSRLLKFVGSISYPLYLVHQMIGFAIIHYLEINGLTSTWFILVPIIISMALGYILHRFVEVPIPSIR